MNQSNPLLLERFDYGWNKRANMLYLEAPVGVGFSYSTDPTGTDYHCTDDSTAQDNLHAVEAFYTKFPELKSSGLYVITSSGLYGIRVCSYSLLYTLTGFLVHPRTGT